MTGMWKGAQSEYGSEDGSLRLPQPAAEHLGAAIEQMELLVQSRQTDPALRYLVSLLQHLREVGRAMS